MVCSQVLDNAWVLYGTQKTALLLKFVHDACSFWRDKLKKGRVEDFSSTGKVITHGLADGTIRPNAKRLSFEEFNSSIAKVKLGLEAMSHDLQEKLQ